jgi:glycosyltransferase involved in cell wall biosynthesis
MNCPPASAPPDPAASPLARLRREGETLLVYVGGFTPNRGLENLVRAMRLLPGGRLALVGFGPLEAALRAEAARAGAAVDVLPAVPPDEVVPVAAGGDVGLAPYLPVGLNNVLAAPNKLYEYLHAGLAVAGSDVPEIRRVVVAHEVGALFDAADAGSVAAAVGALVADGARLALMKRRARDASGLYSWETQERALLEVYERLAR